MTVRERVNGVLADWCGQASFEIDPTVKLSDLWISTRNNANRPHNGIDFQPDGVQDLLVKLTAEFKKPGSVRKRISVLTANSFKPSGDIDSVDNLVDGVVHCPNLPATPGGATS